MRFKFEGGTKKALDLSKCSLKQIHIEAFCLAAALLGFSNNFLLEITINKLIGLSLVTTLSISLPETRFSKHTAFEPTLLVPIHHFLLETPFIIHLTPQSFLLM